MLEVEPIEVSPGKGKAYAGYAASRIGRWILAIAEAIVVASGWRRCLIAFCSGGVGALALSPFDLWPVTVIPMTTAVWLIDGSGYRRDLAAGPASLEVTGAWKSAGRAFWTGWWWGFGYFLASLWWLGAAFLVEAEEFAWALPLGVVGLPAFLALYPGLGFLLARSAWSPGPMRLCAFAAAMTFSEWLRGHLFTGFPWNSFGMALGGDLVFAQLASVVGLYGLTLVVTFVFAAPATFADTGSLRPSEWSSGRRWLPRPFVVASVALALAWGFGLLRLDFGHPGFVAGVKLRIMQPDLAQDEKFRPENKEAILAHYIALSRRNGPDGTHLEDVRALIWPESAFPFILSRDRAALAEIGAILAPGTVLVTGAARQADVFVPDELLDAAFASGFRPKYFNAVQVLGSGGRILDTYDKVHLVPFGEYLPLRPFLERFGLHHFVHVPGGFEPGSARRLLRLPGLPPLVPLVCYEAIFSAEVMPENDVRPGWMLNVTNDGWFGTTAGPYQHLAQARLRAIEEGLPLVRAANTGISAVIDPYGRITGELPLGRAGILDASLPQGIAMPLFARYPAFGPFAAWLVMVMAAVAGRLRIDRASNIARYCSNVRSAVTNWGESFRRKD